MKRWFIAISIIIALTGVGYSAVLLTRPSQKPVQAQIAQEPLSIPEIHRLVNIERVKAGQEPFILDERLDATAQRKANERASGNVNSSNPHLNLDGVHGYTYTKDISGCHTASENLQYNADNNELTVLGWMNSKPHHDAMLSPNYHIVGYGISGRYVVQHMC